MLCPEFEDRLNELLDLRQVPSVDADVAHHAAHCADCRRLLAGYEMVRDAAPQLVAPAAPANLAERVVRAHLAQRPPLAWRAAQIALAVAAVLLVALWLWRTSLEQGPRAGAPAAALPDDAAREMPRSQQPAHVPPPPDERAGPVAAPPALAAETQQTLADAWAFVPQLDAASADDSTFADAAWQPSAVGLNPVSESTTDAVAFLMDVLSVGTPPDSDGAATDEGT
jgi:hypothetical protein